MINKTYTIWCDNCSEWTEDMTGHNMIETIKNAKKKGWIRKKNKDLCPKCANKITPGTQG